MNKWVGKVAVVTGASSGIGEETARQLVENGMIVVGFARRDERLRELEKELQGKPGKFYYQKVDLCSEENILNAFKWVKSTLKTVDVLVNNAGVWISSDLFGNTSDWKQMFNTNVLALNICSREAIKIMQETNVSEGHIINVNSVAGHYQLPFMKDVAIYSATKFSVTAITESLRELMCQQNLPIRVTSISPGAVDTEMVAGSNLNNLPGLDMLKSIDVADAILYALGVPQRVNISEIIIRPKNENTLFFMNNC